MKTLARLGPAAAAARIDQPGRPSMDPAAPRDNRDDRSHEVRAPAVELSRLTKTFGDFLAVDDVSAVALPGQVTALLGPNGAGKTTTLRMLLGLVAPSGGTATFDGKRYDDLSEPVREVGALLEASGYHPGRTALAHLRIIASAAKLSTEAPERVLEETGLAGDARRRVGEFSLGMRQRLGLATAMLGDPSVLVLDEPTNGLDPPGIRWLRGYVRRLADEGRTVLLSSHALSEVEQTADHVLVLAHGRLLRSSSLAEFRAEAGIASRVRTPHAARLGAALDAACLVYRLTDDGITVDAPPEEVGEVAAAHGVVLHSLAGSADLERAFFRLIQDADRAERPRSTPEVVS
jgi:ABC-2 type transport system ATP-binding protein